MSYPKAMQYFASKMSGFSRSTVKLQFNYTSTVKGGETISFDLPANSLCLLDTLRVHGRIKTFTNGLGGDAEVRYAWSLLDSVALESGGISLTHPSGHQNFVHSIYSDFQDYDKQTLNRVLGLERDVISYTDGSLDSWDTDAKAKQFVISQFPVISSMKPQLLPTELFPNGTVRVVMKWADNGQVMMQDNAASTNSGRYEIDQLRAYIDVVNVDDGVFHQLLARRLDTAPIEIPFTQHIVFVGNEQPINSVTRFSVSSGSVDMLLGTVVAPANSWRDGEHLAGNGTANSVDQYQNRWNTYFARGSDKLTKTSFTVNGVRLPAFGEATNEEAFVNTQIGMGILNDTLGSSNPLIDRLDKFSKYFYVHAYKLDAPADEGERIRSGLDLMGTNAAMEWNTFGNSGGANITPVVICRITSLLQIGKFRQINLIL